MFMFVFRARLIRGLGWWETPSPVLQQEHGQALLLPASPDGGLQSLQGQHSVL